ncbi:MAG: response regulator [Bacteroidales bacterium]|nr:response regulator [Bacteroidales bacterium]
MKRFYLLMFCLFIITYQIVKTQSPNYRFAHISIKDGLSHNQIKAVHKDSKGFVWIGTLSGLNRYDGHNFKIFKREPYDTLSLIDNSIEEILEDYSGKLWIRTTTGFNIFDPISESFIRHKTFTFGDVSAQLADITSIFTPSPQEIWYNTRNDGLIRYNFDNKKYHQLLHHPADTSSISKQQIADIKKDSEGYIWIIYYNGIIEKLDARQNKVIKRTWFLNDRFEELNYHFKLYIDKDDDIWIYTKSTTLGLVLYQPKNGNINYYNTESKNLRLNSNLVGGLVQDDMGKIWVGTDHGGINIIEKELQKITYILHDRENNRSISQNSINCLYKDNQGIIWAGTFKQGLNYYHEKLFLFNLYTNIPSDPYSLCYNDINCFCEDDKGNILVGTNGGGINYFDRETNKFTAIKHDPKNPNSLSNDVVVSMLTDSKNQIWIGTFYGGLNLYDGKQFKHYLHNPDFPRSISDNRVWEIYEDSKNNLWIGTLGGGLELYDKNHDLFLHYSGDDAASVQSEFILSIMEDRRNNLWVGTDNGIFVMEWNTGKVQHYFHSEEDHNSLSNNIVVCLLKDSEGNMWAGTRDGLNLYQESSKSFIKFRTENGLPDNSIITLVEEENGNIWMSTSNGVSKLSITMDSLGGIKDYHILNFDENDGLQGRSFNDKAAFKTSKGEILFGGANGFNIFHPNDIDRVNTNPVVTIVNFELFGEPLSVNEKFNNRIILSKSINNTDKIILKHKENVFSIEFSALIYLAPERIKYRYKLEGFNDQWLTKEWTDRKVTYTNLDPGKYTFKVQAYQEGLNGPFNEAQLAFIIKPPIWRTKIAFLIYFGILITFLLFFRQILLFRARLRFQNEQAHLETERQKELNAIKTRFFTNVSHEFRTPLTLIITPLERLIKKYKDHEIKPQLDLIFSNAKRLNGLINQLLDFRKMEAQRLQINWDFGNIIKFLREVFNSFRDLAESKSMVYSFTSSVDELFMRFDEDKLEKILFNLLSNAFKFTHDKGKIEVDIDFLEINNSNNPFFNSKEALVIRVCDTGIGIHPDLHDKVFERFFQNDQPSSLINKGSGVGLSLTQEFVKLHDGVIKVDSALNKGSTFTVYLPVNRERIEELHKEMKVPQELPVVGEISDIHYNPSNFTILLVEDNEDFRFYLRDNLRVNYRIIEARNGKEAIEIIVNQMPDLIVSDLRMPIMDGLEFCKQTKQNKNTSHIPFILLTASLTPENEIEGLQAGADAYITKPFSFEILESRINNLISQRERTKKFYQKNFKIEPGTIGITSLDEKLMDKALKIVEVNISDTDFSVEKLSNELGFSRVHLYKKMLSITGKTPVEFIRLVRLKRAAQLLKESQLTVSEIAYQVGFTDPRYFSKQFRAEFNMLPSRYKAEYEGQK